ncbi:MAG: ABC transporter ATP-binding protein [Elusimicrobia bacterium]|nr:ABC transporter ATP-binding protein [Elusimicrobiota bacterium]
MPSLIIHTEKLSRRFDGLIAVNEISLDIPKGEVFGLLGPNGAGKTTFISMLSTLLKPTSGRAWVAGIEVSNDSLQVRKNIGIVFQEPSVDDLLTGRENLELHAMLYGMARDERKKRISEMLELVSLSARADSFVKTYSGGMRRRLEIARGLLHQPKVLFLDEPTLGLDPAARKIIWNYVKNLSETGDITIILTTHYMEEADFLCDRIGIIDHGRIVQLGSPEELKRKVGGDIVILEGTIEIEALKGLNFIKSVHAGNGKAEITVMDAADNLPVLLKHAGEIDRVEIRPVTLEDVFLKFTGHEIKNEESQDTIFERIVSVKTNK